MRKHQFWSLLLALPLFFGACSDSGTGPSGKAGDSYVSADLSGDISGKFHAKGSLFGVSPSGYAFGVHSQSDEASLLIIQGVEGELSENYDGRSINLVIVNPRKGTYSIDEFCDEDETTSCAGIMFFDMGDDHYGYWMMSGTLTLTSLTKGRAAGTFSASGIGYDGTDEDGVLQLKNGKFDVQVMDMSELGGSYRNLNAT
jgi:hypothetical protein